MFPHPAASRGPDLIAPPPADASARALATGCDKSDATLLPRPSSRRGFLARLTGLFLAPWAVQADGVSPDDKAPVTIRLLPPPDLGEFDPAYLERWQASARIAFEQAIDARTERLLAAQQRREAVTIHYYGGSQPGCRRIIIPRRLFTVEGYWGVYCEAWCPVRQTKRTFNVDRIEFQVREFN